MFEMQVCRSCLSQWKGKDEMLRNRVQISGAILPNLHLRGHSYCWILCILPCHLLFQSRALTLILTLHMEYTPIFQSQMLTCRRNAYLKSDKNFDYAIFIWFFSTQWVADQGSPHLFSNWYFGIILPAIDDSMQPTRCSFQLYHGKLFMVVCGSGTKVCAVCDNVVID